MQVPFISIVLDQAKPANNHYLHSPCNLLSFLPRYRSISTRIPYKTCEMSSGYQPTLLQTIPECQLKDASPHSQAQSNLG